MPANLSVTPDAQSDATEAADYYESQQAGLGAAFATAIADCLRDVCGSPTRWPVWRGPVRRVKLKRFLHYIYYRHDAAVDLVTVATIFHPSRDPTELARRLGPS